MPAAIEIELVGGSGLGDDRSRSPRSPFSDSGQEPSGGSSQPSPPKEKESGGLDKLSDVLSKLVTLSVLGGIFSKLVSALTSAIPGLSNFGRPRSAAQQATAGRIVSIDKVGETTNPPTRSAPQTPGLVPTPGRPASVPRLPGPGGLAPAGGGAGLPAVIPAGAGGGGAAAASALGPLAIAIGVVVAALAVAVLAVKKFAETLTNEAERLKGLSPAIAVASAQNQVEKLQIDLDRVERFGNQLARVERLRGRVENQMLRIQTEILAIMVRIFEKLEPGLNVATTYFETTTTSFASISQMLESIISISTTLDPNSQLDKLQELADEVLRFREDMARIFGLGGPGFNDQFFQALDQTLGQLGGNVFDRRRRRRGNR